MKKLLRKLKENITVNKKTLFYALISIIFLVIGCKLIPKEISITKYPVIYFMILAVLAGGTLAFKINEKSRVHKILSIFLTILVPLFCFYNTEYIVGNEFSNLTLAAVFMNYGVYLFVFLILKLLFNRTRWAITSGIIIFTLYAVIDAFVGIFRGVMIRTSDIFAMRTAVNVAGGYEFVLTERMVIGILSAVVVFFLASHCIYREQSTKKRLIKSGITLCCFAVFIGIGFDKNNLDKWNLVPIAWDTDESFARHGAVLDFVCGIPFLLVDAPEGYSVEEVKAILDKYEEDTAEAATLEEMPNIIYIMNESFADIEILSELETSEETLEFYKSLNENVIRGNLSVPVYGGSTCNTEFEAITGFTTAFLPAGSYPYLSYVRDDTENLGEQLQEEDYYTSFIHLYDASGYNRRNVYSMFNFDEQIYIDDVADVELIRGFASDQGNYEILINEYEKIQETGKKSFIFNVTIQTHGSFKGEVDHLVWLKGEEGQYPQAEVYLSLLEKSDEAFEYLIDYFKSKEEPVIICMFGDHWPTIEDELLARMEKNSGEDELGILTKEYQTPFLIWANYDIEEKTYENISANYLSTLLLETAGVPLTDYQCVYYA